MARDDVSLRAGDDARRRRKRSRRCSMSRCSSKVLRASGNSIISTTTTMARFMPILRRWRRELRAAAEITGIGLTLLPSFYAHGSFGGAAPHAGQRRFICSVDQFARLMAATEMAVRELPGANVGVAPHSLRAVTPDELAAIAPLAEGGPVHIHAAEQIREVEECIAWSGRRPVEWLLEHAPVDRRWCLIHATHMTATEIIGACRQRRRRRPLPDHRSEPRRRHFSGARIPRRRRPVRRRHGLPTSWSASPTNCVSSNMASD